VNHTTTRLSALGLASLVALAAFAAACGDDESTPGSGGSGGGTTTSSATSTTSSTSTSSSSSASTSSTSQGTTTGGEGGQGGGTTSGDGGAGGSGGGDGGSGGGSGGGDGSSFDAAWTLLVGPDTVDCFFLGGEYVDVYYQRDGEEAVVERYSCFDEGGLSPELPVGDYTVQATLLDFEEEVILGADPVEIALGPELATVDLEFAAAGARLSASWSLIEGGVEATCQSFGASHTEVSLYNVDNGLGYGSSFECPLGEGTTRYIPLGNYEVILNLLDFDVIVDDGEISTISLQDPDETRVLPEYVFNRDTDQ
jgi:hypothetical protein